MGGVPESVVTVGAGAGTGAALAARVLRYEQTLRGLVTASGAQPDWAPLADFVAVDDFRRVGTFLEEQDWQQYTEMLGQWASATDSFETTVRRISEVGRLVYFEIEERHHRSGRVDVVNSMTVFEFDEDGRILRLDVYLQRGR